MATPPLEPSQLYILAGSCLSFSPEAEDDDVKVALQTLKPTDEIVRIEIPGANWMYRWGLTKLPGQPDPKLSDPDVPVNCRITDNGISLLLNHPCMKTTLIELIFEGLGAVSDFSLFALKMSPVKSILRELSVADCKNFTVETLRHVIPTLSSLRILDLTGCSIPPTLLSFLARKCPLVRLLKDGSRSYRFNIPPKPRRFLALKMQNISQSNGEQQQQPPITTTTNSLTNPLTTTSTSTSSNQSFLSGLLDTLIGTSETSSSSSSSHLAVFSKASSRTPSPHSQSKSPFAPLVDDQLNASDLLKLPPPNQHIKLYSLMPGNHFGAEFSNIEEFTVYSFLRYMYASQPHILAGLSHCVFIDCPNLDDYSLQFLAQTKTSLLNNYPNIGSIFVPVVALSIINCSKVTSSGIIRCTNMALRKGVKLSYLNLSNSSKAITNGSMTYLTTLRPKLEYLNASGSTLDNAVFDRIRKSIHVVDTQPHSHQYIFHLSGKYSGKFDHSFPSTPQPNIPSSWKNQPVPIQLPTDSLARLRDSQDSDTEVEPSSSSSSTLNPLSTTQETTSATTSTQTVEISVTPTPATGPSPAKILQNCVLSPNILKFPGIFTLKSTTAQINLSGIGKHMSLAETIYLFESPLSEDSIISILSEKLICSPLEYCNHFSSCFFINCANIGPASLISFISKNFYSVRVVYAVNIVSSLSISTILFLSKAPNLSSIYITTKEPNANPDLLLELFYQNRQKLGFPCLPKSLAGSYPHVFHYGISIENLETPPLILPLLSSKIFPVLPQSQSSNISLSVKEIVSRSDPPDQNVSKSPLSLRRKSSLSISSPPTAVTSKLSITDETDFLPRYSPVPTLGQTRVVPPLEEAYPRYDVTSHRDLTSNFDLNAVQTIYFPSGVTNDQVDLFFSVLTPEKRAEIRGLDLSYSNVNSTIFQKLDTYFPSGERFQLHSFSLQGCQFDNEPSHQVLSNISHFVDSPVSKHLVVLDISNCTGFAPGVLKDYFGKLIRMRRVSVSTGPGFFSINNVKSLKKTRPSLSIIVKSSYDIDGNITQSIQNNQNCNPF